MKRWVMLLATSLLTIAAAPQATREDPPKAAEHVRKARALAGQQFANSLFLCEPQGGDVVVRAALEGSDQWITPAPVFDDLYYIGNRFVGVWVLRTSEGLILFDALQSEEEARERLVRGLRLLGLDPASIRYVVVTHGHWDHYGGAKYLQDTFGARVALSAADWRLMEASPPGSLIRAPMWGERKDRPPPRRDMVIRDGDEIRLGGKTVKLFETPGHSPGTISALIPVQEGRRRHVMSLLGGTAFPPTLAASETTGGLNSFSASVERLAKVSKVAGADGLINTHIFVDGSAERLVAAQRRTSRGRNPFVLGSGAVQRYYAMFNECLKAAAARPARAPWRATLPTKSGRF